MRYVAISAMMVLFLMLAGCMQVSVSEINSDPDKYLGKKVVVSGEVSVPMDMGIMSGFLLKEGDSSLMVRSDEVPSRGDTVTVRGTLVEGMFTGHYIYADSVRT